MQRSLQQIESGKPDVKAIEANPKSQDEVKQNAK
jgi:hypothetical protein